MTPIRLGVLGAGIMGSRVAAAATDTGRFIVTSVADANPDLAAALAADHGAAALHSVDELFDGPPIDAVYVGLPHHLHLPACLAAASAGTHVLIDKPLCNSLEEAGKISAAGRRSTKVWMVGFSYRFRSEWRRAREIIRSGGIGMPYAVSDLVFEAYRKTPAWYWDAASGGGTLQLQSHHAFDRIGWLLGTTPTQVACRVVRLPGGADKSAMISVEYESGAAASISLSFGLSYDAPPKTLFVVQGESGMLQIDEARTLRVVTADGMTVEHHPDDEWLRRELAGFAEAIDGVSTDYPSIADGVAALLCAVASAKSARLNTWVSVDQPASMSEPDGDE